ncbi:MAG: asparagine synthetase B, partial [Gemmatimonadetes bacterium]|nr:asparagine synthetase B [Gemmatimonadota bacterium]NIQ52686.1 asparagine synthetase B [Gemmatimonadota bacterium]NIU72822.1 asparagine synthetase B [Gammaproteobacteria bacterium]NIX45539.1 asparagine synthetase B [Gemmatimonadota bacterium]NIY09831.1 asparagine synthetase B [Gemmatimonadota bacterium]
MCGIVGVWHAGTAGPVDRDVLVRMRDVMVHRGPDGAGLWLSDDRRVGLAHRRLAIVDLAESAGQPMTNEDGTVVVAFNGEIYNHLELRRELEAAGHVFRTDHSDTEVIVHGYEEWGLDCVERFRGMFAFGLWDGSARRLWLVRDRIGVKPLYWTTRDGRFRFASETKALLADPDVPRRVNVTALYHYLSFLTTPAPDTLFDGIRKLPGGCWITVDADGDVDERRWWDVWDEARELGDASEDELADALLRELR